MQKYICDVCGYTSDLDTSADIVPCPVCKGRCITEQSMHEREELQKNLEDDDKDDDYSPEQDAKEEAIDYVIIEGMNKNMKELGNDKLYHSIEDLPKAGQRARYRKYFLMVGGQIPQKTLLGILSEGGHITYTI